MAIVIEIRDEGTCGLNGGQVAGKPGNACQPILASHMLATNPGEAPMKKMLLAALCGLLCVGAAREGIADPSTMAPLGQTSDPSGGAAPLSRNEYLPKLQEFYARGKAIYVNSRSDKLTDVDIDLRFKEFVDWANEAGNWMSAHINPAATAKFTTWHAEFGKAHKLAGSHPQEENNKFQNLNVVLPQLLGNLQFLIKPGAVDALGSKEESSK
jgi:hypothetical protein